MEEKFNKDDAKKLDNRDSNTKEKTRNSFTSKHVAAFSFCMGIVGVLVYIILIDPLFLQKDITENFYDKYAAGADNITPQVLDLFMTYDENLDGKISVKEFVPIAERLQGSKVKIS